MTTNGIGPAWFPAPIRSALTKVGSQFFDEASWAKHDEGYARKSPSRHKCDTKFLQAMLRDASKVGPIVIKPIQLSRALQTCKIMGCITLALLLWAAVRLGGWYTYYFEGNDDDRYS